MKRSSVLALGLIVAMVVGSAVSGGTVQAAEKVTKWKLQTLWSAGELPFKRLTVFCAKVKEATGGRLEIKPLPAGSIVPTFETLDAVKNNIIQVMNVWPGYFVGKEAAFAPLSDLICAYEEPWEYTAFFYYRGGLDLLNELYEPYNVHSIGIVMWGRESMFTKFPVEKPEDFKGHKFRSPQGMTADMLKMLGAGVVVLPGEEVYSALDKGVVDGADWSTPSVNHRMGFSQVAKHYIWPGFRSMPVSDFTINKKEWEKLPSDIQTTLTSMVRELNDDTIIQCAIDDHKAFEEMADMGVMPVSWSQENIAKLREMVRTEIWTDWASKSEMSEKVINAQLNWLKELGRLK